LGCYLVHGGGRVQRVIDMVGDVGSEAPVIAAVLKSSDIKTSNFL
jgi:hypothetical protein